MHNLIMNIRDRNIGNLEQACERYAIMAYEVLWRELAVGFKSITYSYIGDKNDRFLGAFIATMIPFKQTGKYRHGHRAIQIRFDIQADQQENCWHLSDGRMTDAVGGMQSCICFSRGAFKRIAVIIPDWDEMRFASNADHNQASVYKISSGKKPWGEYHPGVTI